MTDSEKIVNYSIWVFFVLVYLSGSTILVFTVPTFPLFLIFVFLVELILVANMILRAQDIMPGVVCLLEGAWPISDSGVDAAARACW